MVVYLVLFIMKNEVMKKSFYLTSLFADIKSDNNWTTYEAKLTLMLFAELEKYKIYLPDFNNFDNDILLYRKEISKIPQEYTFSKKQFQDATGVKTAHLSRDIKKTIKS